MVVGENVAHHLKPFDERLEIDEVTDDDGEKYFTNLKGRWDWYVIGGRWSGALKLRPGATSGIMGERSDMHPTGVIGAPPLEVKEGWVDSALKKDIDFEAMNARIKEDCGKTFTEYSAASEEQRKRFYFDKEDIPLIGESCGEYVARTYKPWSTYAALYKGTWYERSTYMRDIGTFSYVQNWQEIFSAILEHVQDEERITIVDIHS